MSGVNTIITETGKKIVVKYEKVDMTIPGVTGYTLLSGKQFIINNQNVIGIVDGHLDDNITINEG